MHFTVIKNFIRKNCRENLGVHVITLISTTSSNREVQVVGELPTLFINIFCLYTLHTFASSIPPLYWNTTTKSLRLVCFCYCPFLKRKKKSLAFKIVITQRIRQRWPLEWEAERMRGSRQQRKGAAAPDASRVGKGGQSEEPASVQFFLPPPHIWEMHHEPWQLRA